MIPQLKTSFEKLEAQRAEIIQFLKNCKPEKITASPAEKWSSAQIVAHIILSEQLALQYMKKKILGIGESPKTGIWEAIKFVLLKVSQRIPLKYKAPKVLGEQAPPHLSLAELDTNWSQSRAELATFLEQFTPLTATKQVYKHPFAGKLNIVQGIAFMREHIIHHLPQIKSRAR